MWSPASDRMCCRLPLRTLLRGCLLALLTCVCGVQTMAQDFLGTREYKVKKAAGKVAFDATVEFPVEGPRRVLEGVAAWLAQTLEVDGDFTGNGQRLLQCACDSFMNSGQKWKRTVTVERTYEDQRVVTFQSWIKDVDSETWRTADCASFSKKDGHRIQLDEIFKCSEDELKELMWEYRGDLKLDTDNPSGLYPLNAGFIDGWVVVIAPAYHQMGAEFQLRYLEILPALYTTEEGYYIP